VPGGVAAGTVLTATATVGTSTSEFSGNVTVQLTPTDLIIDKSHSGNFTQGQNHSYTITVSNSGGASSSGAVTVTDTLPAGLTPGNATGTGWTCGTAGQTVTCTRPDALAGSASYPAIDVPVSVAPDSALSLTNTASVSGGGDSNTGNNSDSDPTTIIGVPDLTIAKTHAGNFTRGQSGAYTITVSNAGGAATSGVVTVTDTLPAGLTPLPSSSGTGWTCGVAGQTLTCTRADALAAAGSYPDITLTVDVLQSAAANVTNTASVSGGAQTNTGNDTASDPTTIVSSADLSLSKTVSNPDPIQGQQVTFTLTLSNAGPSDATNLVVTDQLPAGLTFVSATPSAGTYDSPTGAWAVPSLGSGAGATLQLVAQVSAAGSMTNTAEVTAADQPDPDSTPANNNGTEDDQASASIGATTPPEVELIKSVTPTGVQSPGTDLTYTIVFNNQGGSVATSLIIYDKIPAETEFKLDSATYDAGTSGLPAPVIEYTTQPRDPGSEDPPSPWVSYTPAGAPGTYDNQITYIRFVFSGNLNPGASGSVSFTVRIQ
jgi:uncharacterized repeat protein (TIGR01451 family)